jgi:predicted nuclease of predicted toxin-antitoxin system
MGASDRNGTHQPADWRFLIDENLSPSIATILQRSEYRAEHVHEALFEGALDFDDILPYCCKHDAVLVTNDVRDFNERVLLTREHCGVILVYDKQRSPKSIAANCEAIAKGYGERTMLDVEVADDWSTQ